MCVLCCILVFVLLCVCVFVYHVISWSDCLFGFCLLARFALRCCVLLGLCSFALIGCVCAVCCVCLCGFAVRLIIWLVWRSVVCLLGRT